MKRLIRDDMLRPSSVLIQEYRLRPSASSLTDFKSNRQRNRDRHLQERYNAYNKKKGMIYCIINTITGERYIGATTTSIGKRFQSHKRAPAKRESALSYQIRSFGLLNFRIQHLATALEREYLAELEMLLIEQERPEYNIKRKPYPHQNWVKG